MKAQSLSLILPAIGALIAGGQFAGILSSSDGAPYALVKLPATVAVEGAAATMTLPEAQALAQQLPVGEGLQADLPTRIEGLQLFQALPDDLDASDWYWLREQAVWAPGEHWAQTFHRGGQTHLHQGTQCRACLVLRLTPEQLADAVAAAAADPAQASAKPAEETLA